MFECRTIAALINGLKKCRGWTKVKVKQMLYFFNFCQLLILAGPYKCHPYVLGRTNVRLDKCWVKQMSLNHFNTNLRSKCSKSTFQPHLTSISQSYLDLKMEDSTQYKETSNERLILINYTTLSGYGCRGLYSLHALNEMFHSLYDWTYFLGWFCQNE